VKRNGYTKVVMICGDKDFVPLLDYIVNDAEIWILAFNGSISTELYPFCINGGVKLITKHDVSSFT